MRYGVVVAALALLAPIATHGEQKPGVPASNVPAGITLQQTPIGAVFANADGLTAYVFDKDTVAGASACNGNCAKAWPPLAPPADAKPAPGWSFVTREDGSRQWAYKGRPLYTFAQWDAKAGDVRGNDVGGIWHVARP